MFQFLIFFWCEPDQNPFAVGGKGVKMAYNIVRTDIDCALHTVNTVLYTFKVDVTPDPWHLHSLLLKSAFIKGNPYIWPRPSF